MAMGTSAAQKAGQCANFLVVLTPVAPYPFYMSVSPWVDLASVYSLSKFNEHLRQRLRGQSSDTIVILTGRQRP